MTAHIVNADNPSPAPTHSVPGVPPVQDTVEPEPVVEPVEVHDHAVEYDDDTTEVD